MAVPNTHFECNDVLMELLRQISDPNSSITDTQVIAICAAVSTESTAFFRAFNEVNAAGSGNIIPIVNTAARAMRSHADQVDTAAKPDEAEEITPDESEEDKAVQKPLLPQGTTEQTELLPGDLDFTGSVYETLFQCQSEVKSGVYLVNDGPVKRRNIMKQSFNPNRWGLTDLDHEIRSLRKEQPEVDINGQIAALLDYCPFTLRHQLCALKHNCPLHKICVSRLSSSSR